MFVVKNYQQLAIWIALCALLLCSCNAADHEAAATQPQSQTSVPSSSDLRSVAVSQDQDWIARHQEEDRAWASRTSLTPEQVRKLRLASDVPDDEAAYIDNIETEGLRSRNHILLVTAGGNGHCLELIIFERKGDDFQRIWSIAEMPSGAGFCRESPLDPQAYAAPNGEIIVKVPVFDYNKGVAKATNFYTYKWSGKTYEFAGSTTKRM